MKLLWHRRDLRVADNRAMAAASAEDDVVPVFVLDPTVLSFASSPRVAFLLDGLADLRVAYRKRGSDLLVGHGDPADVLPALAADHGADGVAWNRDYTGLARERDAAVRTALADDGLAVDAHHDLLVHEPGSITTNEGNHYSVFSFFWKKWRDRPADEPIAAPPDAALASVEGEPIPTLADLDFEPPTADVAPADRASALGRLEEFCTGPIYEYADHRDDPAAGATSRLSAYLRWWTLGPREVQARTAAAARTAPDETAAESVAAFQRQVAWREFYTHLLAARPDVVAENYQSFARPVEWRNDPDEIAAWRRGETGFPFVDAGMRQLRDEGWLHNRLRMVVAAFLTKDLLADWRIGYDWFRQRLVDHDPANDSGGWQWAASTGTDSQPYRIFNPTTQGERFDPEATYIRENVPELRAVPASTIHDWPDLSPEERSAAAPDYPGPIVDHYERREEAIAAFERAKG